MPDTNGHRHELRRWPPLENDLGIGWVHPVPLRIRIPCDEVPAGNPPHHLVRPGDDPSEGGTRALPVPGGEIRIEHQRLVVRGQLGDLAQQPAAVGTANGIEDLSQLPAPEVRLVCGTC